MGLCLWCVVNVCCVQRKIVTLNNINNVGILHLTATRDCWPSLQQKLMILEDHLIKVNETKNDKKPLKITPKNEMISNMKTTKKRKMIMKMKKTQI